MTPSLSCTHNLKLLGAVFIQETDGYAHYAGVVGWDGGGEGHLDGLVVVVALVANAPDFLVFAELDVFFQRHESKCLVPAAVLDVGEPNGRGPQKCFSVYSSGCRLRFFTWRNFC